MSTDLSRAGTQPTASEADALVAAASFLQEAVYASRELTHRAPLAAAEGGCGLGERPEIPERWSPAQARAASQLAQALGGVSLGAAQATALEEAAGRWVRIQDGLDRKRNHFLKAFRMQHGADRKQYRPDVAQELADGLDEINGENRHRLALAAEHLLASLCHPSPS